MSFPVNLSAFFGAFGHRWLSLMSGPLTVPFALLAVVLEQTWQKVLFAALAIISAFVASYVTWRAERVRANGLQAELERLNTLDISVHMIEPLILFSDSTRGRRFVLIPNVHLTNRSTERRAIEVALRIYPKGFREWRGFYYHCPPMLTPTNHVQSSVQAAPVWTQPIVFAPQLGMRFDLEPRATVQGSLVFEIIVGRGLPIDLSKLKSVPMFFHFKDHISRVERQGTN